MHDDSYIGQSAGLQAFATGLRPCGENGNRMLRAGANRQFLITPARISATEGWSRSTNASVSK
jgi:hypothetical protein